MAAFAYAAVLCGFVLAVIGVVFVASFVTLWPYNMHLSLRHYRFEVQQGLAPLWTSIGMSFAAALIGVVATIAAACLARRLQGAAARALYFLSLLPAAVPGMVKGLGYVLVFNDPRNPLGFLYGTVTILAFCTVYHYHAQGYLIATTSLNQVSRVFDEASASLGGSYLKTLRAVTLPIIGPALASIGVFFFVRSMVTLSALIFIVTPQTQVAAVSVLLLDDSGNQNQAAAYSVCIMVVVGVVLAAFHGGLRLMSRRSEHYASSS
jgi:iron(III) transport system permease protein